MVDALGILSRIRLPISESGEVGCPGEPFKDDREATLGVGVYLKYASSDS